MMEPWKDEELLRELYHGEGLTQSEIADQFGCSDVTVSNWMQNHGVDAKSPEWKIAQEGTDSPFFVNYARFESVDSGHEVWHSRADGRATVIVHRLAAVAWLGYDAVVDKDVHHINGIPWDTREENLDVLDPSEHRSYHAKYRKRDCGRFVRD